ncbi:NADPH-dependent 1-acyldihydroxyacetone phosphate reductase [[Candida] anglica]|uniref:NADPH-dependent 1-acyldihydroxyacetone phosphate reductase n=1 Tax=[Candida] anglica TaxID=148631 RepID=A0ABP0EB61_9ASCO
MPQPVALVTGASSGIGYAISIELAKRGYKVYAGARRMAQLKKLEEYMIIPIELDITSLKSVQAAKDLISSQNDQLDILFNNAGVIGDGPAMEISDEAVSACMEVNFNSQIRVTREFSPLVVKAKGVIAFTGSTAGRLILPFGCVYSASKAALNAYASTLAFEVEPFGVKVVNFISGGVKTDMTRGESKPSLPTSSSYIVNGLDLLRSSRENIGTEHFMDAETYATKVVNDVEYALKGKSFLSGNYFVRFRGTSASIVKILTDYFPRGLVAFLFLNVFKLKAPFKEIEQSRK